METVKFISDVVVIKGNDINPIQIGENNAVATINITPSNTEKSYVSGHTQGHLRFKATLGSLTDIRFKIYFYTAEVSSTESFVQTVSSFSGAEETISPVVRKITADGNYDYYFTIPACDGIVVYVWGTGSSNTGSKLEKVHLALRTN